MPHSTSLCYDFDTFQFDVDQRVLTRAGKAVSLTPKATDILILLLRNAGQLVEKDELMKEVWPNTFVEEANVTQNIFTLRRALGETESDRRYIETVARRGYRFVAEVKLGKAPARGCRDLSSLDDDTLLQSPPSLAVLPFSNGTGDEKFEYLAEGITDNLTNNLSRIEKLRIISRSALFRLRSDQSDPQEIGRALGVDAILSGKIQLRGGDLVVSAQLIEVHSGWQLWGESFDLSMKDILEVQDEIARQISSTLRLKLTGEEEKRITTRYTENSAAYQAYLEGRFHWSKYTKAGIEKAIVHFREAIEFDPNYALAYSGIIDCYLRLATNYLPPEADLSPLAQNLSAEYQRELSTEDKFLARLTLRQGWDWKGAERELRRSSELKTVYPTAHQWQFAYQHSVSLFKSSLQPADSEKTYVGKTFTVDFISQFRFCRKLPPTEEVQILCIIAREQTQIGNLEAACLLLMDWWTIGKWPPLSQLGFHACTDLLFTLGMLAGYVASTRQIAHGQKHAEALLNSSIAFSEQLGSKWLASEARIELARSYYREGHFDLARATAREALIDVAGLDNELRGVCLVLLGAIERDSGRLRDSYSRLSEAEEMLMSPMPLVSGRFHHEMATTLKEMAISSFSEEYAERALQHFHDALFSLEAIGNHRHSAAAENNFGYLLLNLGRLEDSGKHLLRARRLFSHFGDAIRSAQVDDTLAHLYLETNQLALANETISSAVKVLESTDEDGLLAEALTTKGMTLFKTSRLNEAKRAFEGAYRIAERCGDHEGAGRALLVMTECLGNELDNEERREACRALKRLLALTQQASIVARLKKTLARLDGCEF